MLLKTFDKIHDLFHKSKGYITTAELKKNKITAIQINELVQSGHVERVAHGLYWWKDEANGKPDNYKMIEVFKVNNNSIICSSSALYYYGIIDTEPENLSVATARTDRTLMKMNFPLTRHYFSDAYFYDDIITVTTEYGDFQIYTLERSLCDYIRLARNKSGRDIAAVLTEYSARNMGSIDKLRQYAEKLNLSQAEKNLLINPEQK